VLQNRWIPKINRTLFGTHVGPTTTAGSTEEQIIL
jgi:hypothetical protein